jgi:hypothetical protein
MPKILEVFTKNSKNFLPITVEYLGQKNKKALNLKRSDSVWEAGNAKMMDKL